VEDSPERFGFSFAILPPFALGLNVVVSSSASAFLASSIGKVCGLYPLLPLLK
jgi:hypothetical protein